MLPKRKLFSKNDLRYGVSDYENVQLNLTASPLF